MEITGIKKFYKRLAEINKILDLTNSSINPHIKPHNINKILCRFITKIKKVPDLKCYIPPLNDYLNCSCSCSIFEKREEFVGALKSIQVFILDNCDISSHPVPPLFNFETLRSEYTHSKLYEKKRKKTVIVDTIDNDSCDDTNTLYKKQKNNSLENNEYFVDKIDTVSHEEIIININKLKKLVKQNDEFIKSLETFIDETNQEIFKLHMEFSGDIPQHKN